MTHGYMTHGTKVSQHHSKMMTGEEMDRIIKNEILKIEILTNGF